MTMDGAEITQAPSAKPFKAFIACTRCKTRKRKCDGGTPKCGNCELHNAECSYAAIRKTRGPGKSKSSTAALQNQSDRTLVSQPSLPSLEGRLSSTSVLCPTAGAAATRPSHSTESTEIPIPAPPSSSSGLTRKQTDIRDRIQLFPDFLLPGSFNQQLGTFRTSVAAALTRSKFTPLMPAHISRRLINNSFTEFMEEYQLLNLENFMPLLDAQYTASDTGPEDNPARWALVNAVISLALRAKTASGCEDQFSDITSGFWQNATMVLPELILGDSSLLAIQAVLAMAMFARGLSDTRAFVMLTTNASRQLELYRLGQLSSARTIDTNEVDQYEQTSKVAHAFDEMIKHETLLPSNGRTNEEEDVEGGM